MAITDRQPTTQWEAPRPPGEPPQPSRRSYAGPAVIALAVVLIAVIAGVMITHKSTKASGTNPAPQVSTPGSVGSAPGQVGSTTPTTTQRQATEAAILAGYKTAEAIFLEDANAYPANALDPRIAQHMTGPELRTVQTYLTQLRIQGHHGVGTWTLTPRVTLISTSTTATIIDCISDHTSVVDGRTGKTISGPDTKTTSDQITMVLQSGTWMMSDDQRVGVGCVPAP